MHPCVLPRGGDVGGAVVVEARKTRGRAGVRAFHRVHPPPWAHLLRGDRANHWPPGFCLRASYAPRMRSSGTSTRLMPLKLKSNSMRYVGGSAEARSTIVPSASCTFWLKVTPLIVRPLRFTFT